jgi:hypothetical protein
MIMNNHDFLTVIENNGTDKLAKPEIYGFIVNLSLLDNPSGHHYA